MGNTLSSEIDDDDDNLLFISRMKKETNDDIIDDAVDALYADTFFSNVMSHSNVDDILPSKPTSIWPYDDGNNESYAEKYYDDNTIIISPLMEKTSHDSEPIVITLKPLDKKFLHCNGINCNHDHSDDDIEELNIRIFNKLLGGNNEIVSDIDTSEMMNVIGSSDKQQYKNRVMKKGKKNEDKRSNPMDKRSKNVPSKKSGSEKPLSQLVPADDDSDSIISDSDEEAVLKDEEEVSSSSSEMLVKLTSSEDDINESEDGYSNEEPINISEITEGDIRKFMSYNKGGSYEESNVSDTYDEAVQAMKQIKKNNTHKLINGNYNSESDINNLTENGLTENSSSSKYYVANKHSRNYKN